MQSLNPFASEPIMALPVILEADRKPLKSCEVDERFAELATLAGLEVYDGITLEEIAQQFEEDGGNDSL